MPRDSSKPAEADVMTSPVLAVGLGRGGGGKSTGLAELVWRAKSQGRDVIVADGDARSKTLSGLFPDAIRPASEEVEDVKEFITGLLDRILEENRSAVLDLGGGDRSLVEFGRDLKLVEFCENVGIQPLAIYFLGPDPEDLAHVVTLWQAGFFRPERSLLVFNEGIIRSGKTPVGAFDKTVSNADLEAMVTAGAKPIFMHRLAVMDAAKASGGGLYDAAAGKGSFGPTQRHMVLQWIKTFEAERKQLGVADWLP